MLSTQSEERPGISTTRTRVLNVEWSSKHITKRQPWEKHWKKKQKKRRAQRNPQRMNKGKAQLYNRASNSIILAFRTQVLKMTT